MNYHQFNVSSFQFVIRFCSCFTIITDVYKPEGLIPLQSLLSWIKSWLCVRLVLCSLICNGSAAIILMSFTMPSSLPIKEIPADHRCKPTDHHTMALWDLEFSSMRHWQLLKKKNYWSVNGCSNGGTQVRRTMLGPPLWNSPLSGSNSCWFSWAEGSVPNLSWTYLTFKKPHRRRK